MPTMIPVQITQTQEENDNPTMALPVWGNLFVPEIPEIPEKKLTKKTLNCFEFKKKSGPTHALRPVTAHMRKVKNKNQSNKKESKTHNSKKKTGKAKHGAFAKLDDDYKNKGDAMVARSYHLQQLSNLARGIEN